jgi:uracil-xanthine permease
MTEQASIHPVDEVLPWRQLAIFGLQHVLVVVTFPISSAFLIAKSLSLSSELTIDLISAAFLVCGIGTLVQSLGLWRFGARMPFVMVPGGAPILLFVLVAKQTDLQTAVGSVMIAAAAYFLVLPVFAKCLRFFPRIVIGTVLIIVSVNLIKIYGATIIGTPNTPDFASPIKVCLALATVGCTVVSAMLFKGFLGRLSVLLGLLAGSILAAALGVMHFDGVFSGPLLTFPSPMPFGVPHFDLLAALPLVIFSVISMVEATGQTVAIAEVVGKEIDPKEMVSRTIRTDALMSLIGGFFGTSMIITSSENVGVVQATGVRSRYVTVAAGIFLIVIAVLAPVGRLANAIPAPVIGGAALIAFSIIGVIGINFMRGLDLHERSSMFTLASGLTMGLLPIVVPGIYSNFPQGLQTVLNNGLAIGAITAVVVNILFNYISLGSGYFTGKPELETQEGLGP